MNYAIDNHIFYRLSIIYVSEFQEMNISQAKVAHWLRRIIEMTNIAGYAVFVAAILAAGFSIIATINGGTIGMVHAQIEWQVMAPALLSAVLFSGALIYVTSRLGAILMSLENGDPFIDENAQRLKELGLCLGVVEILRNFVKLIAIGFLKIFGQPNEGFLWADFTPNFVVWFGVVILLLLAQIFKEGARLRQLEKLTI